MINKETKYSWGTLQDRLRSSIVSIASDYCCNFDTSSSGCYNGTGFIVDSKQGIILSNRHIMGTGPATFKATFFNNQEIRLQPTYYDPVLDFAFFRYSPEELNNGFKPKNIKLAPEKARSGLEFRIIGNNSNEKMSVCQGELSQIDRNAPKFDGGSYSDFNTFYIQASSTAKGGSSGSPVVDIEGDAVAIQAGGGCTSATVYLLPLQRVVYALKYVRQREIPPRGTLQTVFTHITHAQAGRLGLCRDVAEREGISVKNSTGLLSVQKILPQGPADDKLRVGDILVSVNGQPIPGFVELADIMDGMVGKLLNIRVFRSSGKLMTVTLGVQDLYEITPSEFLDIGGTILHNMSYLKAAPSSVPIKGVYVAKNYFGFLDRYATENCPVIHEVNAVETPNLQVLMHVLQDVRADEPIVVRVKDYREPTNESVFVARLPFCGPPHRLYTQSRATGFWSHQPYLGMTLKTQDPVPVLEKSISVLSNLLVNASLDSSMTDVLKRSSVLINASSMYICNGQATYSEKDYGFVVDKERGFILCSSSIVSNPTSNIRVTFFGLVVVEATLAYTHPLYPISFLKYDPQLLDQGAFMCGSMVAELQIPVETDQQSLAPGIPVVLIKGTRSGTGLEISPVHVSTHEPFLMTGCRTCLNQIFCNMVGFHLVPESNLPTGLSAVLDSSRSQLVGLFVEAPNCYHKRNKSGNVRIGMDVSLVHSALRELQLAEATGCSPLVRVLDASFSPITLESARVLGVDDQFICELMQSSGNGGAEVFKVIKLLNRRPGLIPSLEYADIVLKINGQSVRHIDELASLGTCESVSLTIVRKRRTMELLIPTTPVWGEECRRMVFWAGLYMQMPYRFIYAKAPRQPSQVFSPTIEHGSPASRECVPNQCFVTEIDDKVIETLDDVVRIARDLMDKYQLNKFNEDVAMDELLSGGNVPGRDVKIRVVSIEGEDLVYSLHTNDLYMSPWEMVRGPLAGDKWEWRLL